MPPEGAELAPPPLTAVAGGLDDSAEGLAPSADELVLEKKKTKTLGLFLIETLML